jgi:phenylpyruvate tautomerase PptA (4-oxalocrotonate tautomerase family)
VALARIEVLAGHTTAEKQQMVAAVRAALSESLQAPSEDPLVRLIEYPPGQFTVPYRDRHSDQFALVEVTMFAGRSMSAKRRLYDEIVRRLSGLGVPSHDILIVIHEPPMDNWGVEGGRPAGEVDLGFKVDI